MTSVREESLSKHVQSFASHIYFRAPERMTNDQSEMWTNICRLGIGVVTDEHQESNKCSVTILVTDSFGHTIESECIADRYLLLAGDKVVAFNMFDEVSGSFYTFISLAKHQ